MTNPLSESQALSNVTRISNAINGVTIIGGNPDGYSVEFDGVNDYIEFGDVTAINSATELTINVWVKMDNPSGVAEVCGKYSSGSSRVNIGCNSNLMYFNLSNSVTGYGTVSYTSTEWSMITLVYDGSGSTNADKLKSYIDGVNQTLSFTGTIQATLSNLAAVNFRAGELNSSYMSGNIHSLSILNTALSQSKVTELYNSGVPLLDIESFSSFSDVTNHWALDEGEGIAATDSVGLSDGTLTNGPTWSTDVP